MRTVSRWIPIGSCAVVIATLAGCTINRTVALQPVPATTVATTPAIVTPAPAVVTPAPAVVVR